MFVAGDVGGTKTLLGLYERGDQRPREVAIHAYETNAYAGFTAILDRFEHDIGQPFDVEAVAVGVAGPVVADRARLTNITWDISCAEIARHFGTSRIRLLNDLEAMANSVEVLTPDEVLLLQQGVPRADGNGAVIAAGTGLGESYLHRVDGHFQPIPSEGGHADFAARTDREIAFVRMLRAERGRVEVEDVLSGPGLVNLSRFTHAGSTCVAAVDHDAPDAPAAISKTALAGRCDHCAEALAMFVSAYGAEAGNLGLRGVATSGVFVGGGIAPKILPALQDGRFLEAFRSKGIMTELVSTMPIKVILNPEAGLLGAAVAAQELLTHRV
jgi:glucokinase